MQDERGIPASEVLTSGCSEEEDGAMVACLLLFGDLVLFCEQKDRKIACESFVVGISIRGARYRKDISLITVTTVSYRRFAQTADHRFFSFFFGRRRGPRSFRPLSFWIHLYLIIASTEGSSIKTVLSD